MRFVRKWGFTNHQHWPYGKDGDLIILSGQVVNLLPGTYDFKSIRIDAGGVLQVTPQQVGGWLILGCRLDCVISGQIVGRSAAGNGSSWVFNTTDPNGFPLSYGGVQQPGGAGGGSNSDRKSVV